LSPLYEHDNKNTQSIDLNVVLDEQILSLLLKGRKTDLGYLKI
jgi:hypothetical protein